MDRNGKIYEGPSIQDPMRDFKAVVGVVLFPFFAVLVLVLLYLTIENIHSWFKSFLVGPVTRTPITPFKQQALHLFDGSDELGNLIPEAKIQVSYKRTEVNKFWMLVSKLFRAKTAINKMNEWMAWIFKLDLKGPSIPVNTRTISIKMNGFKHGSKCHEFIPIGKKSPEGYFTYQMFGDNKIQVTNYVEKGISYVAGFCIYIENPWVSGLEYRKEFVEDFLVSTGKSVLETMKPTSVDPEDVSDNSEEEEWVVSYCAQSCRQTMSKMKYGKVLHQEWDEGKKTMRTELCRFCMQKDLVKK
ncbi:hypothetical protein CAEBREN_14528 [Caenorhabditis brenneri]|uniref:Uncharacterized protein n=1 Tax=Caenorhabditis brenneri TaxID=135651 RepID=G0MJR0_CAEBE|nr:hypothetical protein CAEBREN_14528 [Caenorhabditis brenneri]